MEVRGTDESTAATVGRRRVTPAPSTAPTLRDVATVAGVSFKTVSNVVNKDPRVRPATRPRVLEAIDQLGYRPNISARNLRSGRSGVIGLAVPQLGQAYFAQLADDVIQAAEAQGLVVLIEQTGGKRERELEALRTPRLALTDGLLFVPLGLTDEDAKSAAVGAPLVVLGERIFEDADHITMQHEPAARAATQHLIDLGRRRVVLLGAHRGEQGSTAALRFAGYCAALQASGLPLAPELVVPVDTWDRASGARAMRDFVALAHHFDAVFAMNDDLGVAALRVLHEVGLRVPDDVAVIGFDDVDESEYSFPSLSTVDAGRTRIAELGVQMLVELIADGPRRTGLPRTVTPPFRIVQRESTTPTKNP